MDFDTWYLTETSPEFRQDVEAFHNLGQETMKKLAVEAGIENDMHDVDVRIFMEGKKYSTGWRLQHGLRVPLPDAPVMKFFFEWKRNGEVLYQTFWEVQRAWFMPGPLLNLNP